MERGFFAVPAGEAIVSELSASLPESPFATHSFIEARRRTGHEAWILGQRGHKGHLELACGAFLKSGRLNRTLEIPSAPKADLEGGFWQGVRSFCNRHGVTVAEIGSFGSPSGATIPALGDHCSRQDRCEFVLDLSTHSALFLSSNHKRNVKRAQKAGVTARQSRSLDALRTHQELMRQSLERRHSRGERIAMTDDSPDLTAFLESSAAELFQAALDDSVLSSVLVLRAPRGAYYQSAGTSADGMAIGASHFLIHAIANQLRGEGVKTFNLGGAEAGSSLSRFKEGFGAVQQPLSAINCYVGPVWRSQLTKAAQRVRSASRVLSRLGDRMSTLLVYTADPAAVPVPDQRPGLALQAMTGEDLRALPTSDPGFRERQAERLARFGTSYAYAVTVNGEIAHISWLLPREGMEKDPPRVIRPSADRAEITCCETLPSYRGRGLYSFAIRGLAGVARSRGVRRVYMKTSSDNHASQAGIERAGLVRLGHALLIEEPLSKKLLILRRFRLR